MEAMIGEFRTAAEAAGETEVIQFGRGGCNEYCLPLFQQTDSALLPRRACG